MQQGGIHISVLSETHLNDAQTQTALDLIREAGLEGYGVPGTRGRQLVRRGVIVRLGPH